MEAQDTFFSSKKTLQIRGNAIAIDHPWVMGIMNITPDSFFSGSRFSDDNDVLNQAEEMIKEGVDIIDIGGYSSRPGATDISVNEEIERTAHAIELIRKNFPDTYISIDTFRSQVAIEAVRSGADIINDISGGNLDDKMFEVGAHLKVPYILMHMKGNPQNMTSMTEYDNLFMDTIEYFQSKVAQLKSLGVSDIIIDPGFGFSKTAAQNFDILKNLRLYTLLELPILAGLSRKSMIYKNLQSTPDEALNGTTALNMVALINGASILRVHDVKEAVETVKLFNLTYSNSE